MREAVRKSREGGIVVARQNEDIEIEIAPRSVEGGIEVGRMVIADIILRGGTQDRGSEITSMDHLGAREAALRSEGTGGIDTF